MGKDGQSTRLYIKGCFTGYRRSRENQQTGTALLKLDGVNDRAATDFYMGKCAPEPSFPTLEPFMHEAYRDILWI